MTGKNVDSAEAVATEISVYSVDQAIIDEMVVEIEISYGEMTRSRLIARQWEIFALVTHISENLGDTLVSAIVNDIVVTTAILNDAEKDRLSDASEYHYSAKRTQHCGATAARSELLEQL